MDERKRKAAAGQPLGLLLALAAVALASIVIGLISRWFSRGLPLTSEPAVLISVAALFAVLYFKYLGIAAEWYASKTDLADELTNLADIASSLEKQVDTREG